MAVETIRIPFTEREQRFLSFVFTEVFGGGSTQAIQTVLGDAVPGVRDLQPVVRLQSKSETEFIELTESQWRVMYDSVNAVIYGLGPGELQTCTGQYLHDACNLNLRICSHVWGVFQGKYEWANSVSKRIES
jgi:hypothetical protein